MNEEAELSTNAGVLVALGAALGKQQSNPHPGGRAFVLLPMADGSVKVEYLERPDLPVRKSGTVQANDTESYIAAVNRFHNEKHTVIYAALKPASFMAVLNDHTVEANQWRDHRVAFSLGNSKEFDLWSAECKQDMSQEKFAFFIEDNLPDFKNPTGAKMLELALNFKVNRKVNFKSAMNLADGTMQLEYADLQEGGGSGPTRRMPIPEVFTIEIPVWGGLKAKKYVFDARLRYRVDNGTLTIRYDLIRPHKVVEQAFKDVLEQIQAGVKKSTVIFGAPGQ